MCYYMFLMKYLGFWFRFIMADPERFVVTTTPSTLSKSIVCDEAFVVISLVLAHMGHWFVGIPPTSAA